jgi:SAM-dependent methyltransferase
MSTGSSGGFPIAADDWLVSDPDARVLAVGRGSAALAVRLLGRGARVTLIDRSEAEIRPFQQRYSGLSVVAASAEGLPFQPCSFDAVVISQGMHLLAPGLALAEFARVLAPGGRLGLTYTTRDDSVPWVRRLAAVLQAYDPELMTATQLSSVDALGGCSYFPDIEAHSFRLWVPITRDGMLNMVSSVPKLAQLPEPDGSALLAQVAQIYDSSARDPEPLTLPYAVQCWRCEVDHSEFTGQLDLTPDGLQILL